MSGAVLVVDDSLTIRMNLMEMLDAAGLPTTACASLAEARIALAEKRFALVILDVLLPDGDGIQLLQEIRAMPAAEGTAVMLLSTEAEIRDRIRGLSTGADEYVGKPYDAGYLIALRNQKISSNLDLLEIGRTRSGRSRPRLPDGAGRGPRLMRRRGSRSCRSRTARGRPCTAAAGGRRRTAPRGRQGRRRRSALRAA